MTEFTIPLNDIPAEGREFSFAEQELWRDRWESFGLGLTSGKDLQATFFLLPQGDGAVLVRGSLAGSVNVPCDRCAEPFEFDIDISFDVFEETAPEGEEVLDGEESRIITKDRQLHLDMGAILWEEFALALPVKPLCTSECDGLCPDCGNPRQSCQCTDDRDEGDPRLAVLRNLKIK